MKKNITLLSQFFMALFLAGMLISCGEDAPAEGTVSEEETEMTEEQTTNDEDAIVGNVVARLGIAGIAPPCCHSIPLRLRT